MAENIDSISYKNLVSYNEYRLSGSFSCETVFLNKFNSV